MVEVNSQHSLVDRASAGRSAPANKRIRSWQQLRSAMASWIGIPRASLHSETGPYRLACLLTHPIQYHAPLFRYLSRNPAIDLTVFYMSDFSTRSYYDRGFDVHIAWDVPLLEGYRHIFLPKIGAAEPLSFWCPWNRGLVAQLTSHRIEALWVVGYSHNVCLRAMLTAKLLGIKVLMYGDSHLGFKRAMPTLALKRAVLPLLFRTVDAFLATASANRAYYLHYGAPPSRIFIVPYCVDQEAFRVQALWAAPLRGRLRA